MPLARPKFNHAFKFAATVPYEIIYSRESGIKLLPDYIMPIKPTTQLKNLPDGGTTRK